MNRSTSPVLAALFVTLSVGSVGAAELKGNISLAKGFLNQPLFQTRGYWQLPNPILAVQPPATDPRVELVVELTGAGLQARELVRPVLRIRDARFIPSVIPVKPNTKLIIDNQDWMPHLLETTGLQGKRVGPAESTSHTFAKLGAHRLSCTEIPHMVAEVFVSGAPLVTLPEANGAFRFPGIPDGSHTLRIWYRGKLLHTEAVAVRGTTRVDVKLRDPGSKD